MKKFTKGITKKLAKPFKGSNNHIPAVQNVDPQSASESQKVEGTLHLHSSNDNSNPTTTEIPIHSVNQGLSGEPVLQVHTTPSDKEGFDPKSVDAELRGARDGMQSMGLLGKHATSMASAAINGPADLDTMDDFETTYLQPLKIIDTVLGKIADLHPYAKMALGVLSIASKIIIAQAERDKSIHSLLKKLAEVYRFMTQDDNLGKIESMRGIVGKVAKQTMECARFIREYSEKKSFWKRVGKNFVAETD
ncbi:uncharacterized protein EDB93DRAFT_1337942, partial [Suillus bovinus]|uniref:uncharacterized protein n=1 Tax=Suillus bovinus TaxID=48563 RepID=UPI001B860C16